MKSAVRCEFRFFEYILFIADGLEVLPRPLYHRDKQIMLLRRSKGFGMHDDLMLPVNHRYPIVPLDHPVRGLHLGAVIVRDVALNGFTALAGFVLVVP